jgi:UDP-GlcNAc:undecaprenyl-phosphate/decaprenyl-phosphate GlcNAc-1-phosphate transferase
VLKYILIFLPSAAFALAATPAVRRLAIWLEAVDKPGGRRINSEAIPRLGGLSVYGAVAFGLVVSGLLVPYIRGQLIGSGAPLAGMAIAATLVMALGAVDDAIQISPTVKLVGEILAAVVVVLSGYRIESILQINLGWFGPLATIFWIVAVTNAVNMIDGLDGLAAGFGMISGTSLLAVSLYQGQIHSALILTALCGALLGFLAYNSHPARIFLGDSGSLFIGFLLAVTAIDSSNKTTTVVAVCAPFLALGLPLAELIITTLRRTLCTVKVVRLDSATQQYEFRFFGRPALFTADRDHIHHRLLALGIDHRRVVILLYGVCAFFGLAAFAIVTYRLANVGLLFVTFTVLAAAAIGQLGYRELRPLRNGLLLPLFDMPAVNRRLVVALIDLGLVTASFFVAQMITNDGEFSRLGDRSALQVVPLLALSQVSTFWVTGLYRRSYRHAGLNDFIAILKIVLTAGAISWTVVYFAGYWSHRTLTLAVIDTYTLGSVVFGLRWSFRLLEHLFNRDRSSALRVAIYGAGAAGAAALCELQSNPDHGMVPAAFLDDDSHKLGNKLQGIRIYDPGALRELKASGKIDALIISSSKISRDRQNDTLAVCGQLGIPVRVFGVTFEEVSQPATDVRIDQNGSTNSDVLSEATIG